MSAVALVNFILNRLDDWDDERETLTTVECMGACAVDSRRIFSANAIQNIKSITSFACAFFVNISLILFFFFILCLFSLFFVFYFVREEKKRTKKSVLIRFRCEYFSLTNSVRSNGCVFIDFSAEIIVKKREEKNLFRQSRLIDSLSSRNWVKYNSVSIKFYLKCK